GPARHVARGEDAGHAGLELLVDDDAAIDRETGLLRKFEARPDADADDDEIGGERRAIVECDLLGIDASGLRPRWKTTPCCSWRERTKSPNCGPSTFSIGRCSGAT